MTWTPTQWKLRTGSVVMYVVRDAQHDEVDYFFDTWYTGYVFQP